MDKNTQKTVKEAKKRPFISAVIAAFNEENNIIPLTKRLIKVLDNKNYDYEIIYVVAGQDKTLENLKTIKNNKIKHHYSKNPKGLGNDYKIGFSMISKKADYVLTMDADLNHQPEEIPRFLNAIKDCDIVIGSRHVSGGKRQNIPKWKMAISDFTNVFFTVLSGLKIKDKTSGYRLYKKNVLDQIYKRYQSKNFEFLLEILLIAKKLKLKITEVPITFKYRIHGQSKFRILKTGIGYLKLLLKYMWIK